MMRGYRASIPKWWLEKFGERKKVNSRGKKKGPLEIEESPFLDDRDRVTYLRDDDVLNSPREESSPSFFSDKFPFIIAGLLLTVLFGFLGPLVAWMAYRVSKRSRAV